MSWNDSYLYSHSSFLIASSPLTALGDYNATMDTLTFSSSVTSQTFSVQLTNDGVVEGEEQFFVEISTSDPRVRVGAAIASVVILDDDGMHTDVKCPHFLGY